MSRSRSKAPNAPVAAAAANATPSATTATPSLLQSNGLPVSTISTPTLASGTTTTTTPALTTSITPSLATATTPSMMLTTPTPSTAATPAATTPAMPVTVNMSAVPVTHVPPFPPFLMPTPSSAMLVHVIRLAPGADLYASLLEFLRVHRPEAATILSAVGSLTHANLRFANTPNESVKPQPVGHYEIVSLVGTLSLTGSNHVHMSIADSKGHCIGGHLMPTGNIVYTTVELVIGVLPGLAFKRETDPTYGHKELVVYPAANKMAPLFLSPDMSPFMTAPMPPMQTITASLKRKAEDDKPTVIGSAQKKAKGATKVKKEAGDDKDDKNKSKINPSALTLANMPLVLGGGPLSSPSGNSPSPIPPSGSATSPTSGAPASSPKKPQAQLWTPAQFSVFLKSLKLDHLVPIFQWNKVDAKQFLELKLTDIRDRLGIRDPADVANVLNCINILRGSTTSTSPESVAAAPKASASSVAPTTTTTPSTTVTVAPTTSASAPALNVNATTSTATTSTIAPATANPTATSTTTSNPTTTAATTTIATPTTAPTPSTSTPSATAATTAPSTTTQPATQSATTKAK